MMRLKQKQNYDKAFEETEHHWENTMNAIRKDNVRLTNWIAMRYYEGKHKQHEASECRSRVGTYNEFGPV